MSEPPAGLTSTDSGGAAPAADGGQAGFSAVIGRGGASALGGEPPSRPEPLPAAAADPVPLPSVSALLATLPERHRGMRRGREAVAARLLQASAAIGLAFLMVLLWRTWESAHVEGFELELEPTSDGIPVQTGQERWRAITWDPITRSGHPDGNITLRITWDDGTQRGAYQAEVAVLAGGPANAEVNLTRDGASPATIEIAPFSWIEFRHVDRGATFHLEQIDGPAPDATEDRPRAGDFVIEADLVWFTDEDGLVFSALDALALLGLAGIVFALRRPSAVLPRLASRMPRSDAPVGTWLAAIAILSGPVRDWMVEARGLRSAEVAISGREAWQRIAQRAAATLPALVAVLGFVLGVVELLSAVALVLVGTAVRRLLVGAERLALAEQDVPHDRMRTLIPGRDGVLLAAIVLLIPLLPLALADLSLPFVLERQASQLRPFASGLRAAFWGTVWVAVYTLVITIPVSVGAAIWLEEMARPGRLTRFIQALIANLAGVPSIVFGLLGLAVFVQQAGIGMGFGPTVLAAGLTMSTMAMPIVALASQEALRSVPPSLREAAYGVGATRWHVIRDHVLPSALPSILTGSILAISRIIGEAAPLVVVGAAGFISFDPDPLHFVECPGGSIEGADGQRWCTGDDTRGRYTVLPFQIYEWTGRPEAAFRTLAAATSLVLLALLLLINSVAIVLRQHIQRRLT